MPSFQWSPYMTAILHLYMFCMVDGLSLQVRTHIPDKIIPQTGPEIHSKLICKKIKKKSDGLDDCKCNYVITNSFIKANALFLPM